MLTDTSGKVSLFKGDILDDELGIQITSDSNKGTAGVFPIYVDQNNFVKATFDYENQKFVVSGKRKGKNMETQSISLNRRHSYYADTKYSDFIEKHFVFRYSFHY